MDRTLAAGYVNIGGGRRGFRNRDISAGIRGTTHDAADRNAVQEEIMAVIEAAGLTPNASDWTQLLQAIRRIGRIKLLAPTQVYVSPSGSDTTGDGTLAKPFATANKAWNYLVGAVDANGQQITINLAPGTYGPISIVGQIVGATQQFPVLMGDTVTPGNVIISATNDVAISANLTACFQVRGMRVQATGSSGSFNVGGIGLLAENGAYITFRDMEFGACSFAHIQASWNGVVAIAATGAGTAPHRIIGDAPRHMLATNYGRVSIPGAVLTLVGTRNFSDAFAVASDGLINASDLSIVGSATGVRYVAGNLGLINTNGGGASYLPGSIAGSTSNGGLYL